METNNSKHIQNQTQTNEKNKNKNNNKLIKNQINNNNNEIKIQVNIPNEINNKKKNTNINKINTNINNKNPSFYPNVEDLDINYNSEHGIIFMRKYEKDEDYDTKYDLKSKKESNLVKNLFPNLNEKEIEKKKEKLIAKSLYFSKKDYLTRKDCEESNKIIQEKKKENEKNFYKLPYDNYYNQRDLLEIYITLHTDIDKQIYKIKFIAHRSISLIEFIPLCVKNFNAFFRNEGKNLEFEDKNYKENYFISYIQDSNYFVYIIDNEIPFILDNSIDYKFEYILGSLKKRTENDLNTPMPKSSNKQSNNNNQNIVNNELKINEFNTNKKTNTNNNNNIINLITNKYKDINVNSITYKTHKNNKINKNKNNNNNITNENNLNNSNYFLIQDDKNKDIIKEDKNFNIMKDDDDNSEKEGKKKLFHINIDRFNYDYNEKKLITVNFELPRIYLSSDNSYIYDSHTYKINYYIEIAGDFSFRELLNYAVRYINDELKSKDIQFRLDNENKEYYKFLALGVYNEFEQYKGKYFFLIFF
jgi:hypothetical protein